MLESRGCTEICESGMDGRSAARLTRDADQTRLSIHLVCSPTPRAGAWNSKKTSSTNRNHSGRIQRTVKAARIIQKKGIPEYRLDRDRAFKTKLVLSGVEVPFLEREPQKTRINRPGVL